MSPLPSPSAKLFRFSFSYTQNRRTEAGGDSERLLRKFQGLFAKPLTQVVRSDVVRLLDEIVASGTPYRANRALSALKKLMNWGLDRGMVEDIHRRTEAAA